MDKENVGSFFEAQCSAPFTVRTAMHYSFAFTAQQNDYRQTQEMQQLTEVKYNVVIQRHSHIDIDSTAKRNPTSSIR